MPPPTVLIEPPPQQQNDNGGRQMRKKKQKQQHGYPLPEVLTRPLRKMKTSRRNSELTTATVTSSSSILTLADCTVDDRDHDDRDQPKAEGGDGRLLLLELSPRTEASIPICAEEESICPPLAGEGTTKKERHTVTVADKSNAEQEQEQEQADRPSSSFDWKTSFLFWVPSFVHRLAFVVPIGLVVSLYHFFPARFATPYCAGAALYLLFYACLYPGDDKIKARPLTHASQSLSPHPSTGAGNEKEKEKKKVRKRKVAVIGAGPAGLAAAKELLEAGHDVTMYDSTPRIGGEFSNRFYAGGTLTSSPYTTAFSDFEPLPLRGDEVKGVGGEKKKEEEETAMAMAMAQMSLGHQSKEDYSTYLERYAERFGVDKVARLNTKVRRVITEEASGGAHGGCDGGGEALVYVEVEECSPTTNNGGPGCSPRPVPRRDGPFHHVAVCTGQQGVKSNNKSGICPGLEDSFTGIVRHTSDFWERNKDDIDQCYADLAGRRVLTVGLGEAVADILHLVSRMSEPPVAVEASVRGGAFVIPRVNPLNGMNNDFDSTRLRYSLPKFVHNLSIVVCTKLTHLFGGGESCAERSIRFRLFENLRAGPAYVRATKSDAFVGAVASSEARLRPGIARIEGSTCYFVDGTVMEDIDVIVLGTGYSITEENYPFLAEFGGRRKAAATAADDDKPNNKHNPVAYCPTRRLFRMFDPVHGSAVVFIGAGIRPLVGSIPPIAEMQARLFALIVSGERSLPSRRAMSERVAADALESRRDMGAGGANERWRGLVNWIPFMDSIAIEVGCLPKRSWALTRPTLWLKLLAGPMSAFHYRLAGPGSEGGGNKASEAEDVIRRLPVGARKRDLAFFVGLHATVAFFAWPVLALRLVLIAAMPMPMWPRPILCASAIASRLRLLGRSGSGPTGKKNMHARHKKTSSPGRTGEQTLRRGTTTLCELLLRRARDLLPVKTHRYLFDTPARRRVSSVSATDRRRRRPELVDESLVDESRLKKDPESALKLCRETYGDAFRFENAAGNTTVAILDRDMAEEVLRNKKVSFYQASYQSKTRFGLKEIMKSPQDAQKLSTFFLKGLSGRKNIALFQKKITAALDRRMRSMMADIHQGGGDTIDLSVLVQRVVFAANVDALFGPGVYSANFFEDFRAFNESMGSRSAPAKSNRAAARHQQHQNAPSVQKSRKKKNEAVAVMTDALNRARTDEKSGASPIIRDIQAALGANEEESDRVALLLLWGSNVNMLPSCEWSVAMILKEPGVYTALREERDGVIARLRADGDDDANYDVSCLDELRRPVLRATVAEMLRIRTRTNMYRVVTDDCTIGSRNGEDSISLKEGDWVWLFPRLYLHHDSDAFPNPHEFQPERFVGKTCPFRMGNKSMRVFGGGRAPCPGKDYAVMLLSAAIDRILLRGDVDLALCRADQPLPPAVTDTVASTPPPSEQIVVKISSSSSST